MESWSTSSQHSSSSFEADDEGDTLIFPIDAVNDGTSDHDEASFQQDHVAPSAGQQAEDPRVIRRWATILYRELAGLPPLTPPENLSASHPIEFPDFSDIFDLSDSDLDEPDLTDSAASITAAPSTSVPLNPPVMDPDQPQQPQPQSQAPAPAPAPTTSNEHNNEFVPFNHGHEDVVRAVNFGKSFNPSAFYGSRSNIVPDYYGKRKVTAGADHRLKVWNKQEAQDGTAIWKLVDTWRAHDAEVLDAKWNAPFMGQTLGSIGNDLKFKVWEEDKSEPWNSGRRFKCIYTLSSLSRVPYASFDFKSVNINDTFLALLTKEGNLTVYEAADPESLSSWNILDEFRVCNPPVRGEEVGFSVEFDPCPTPCWTAVAAGLNQKALSLVCAGMDTARVWRTTNMRNFYQAADLAGHGGIVRDVAWLPSNTSGFDTIATACKDGSIRIFEVSTLATSLINGVVSSNDSDGARQTAGESARVNPSGIGAGLAGASRASGATSASGDNQDPSKVYQEAKEVANLASHDSMVWRLKWSPITMGGAELVSSGDDGYLRVWRRAINGEWMESAQLSPGEDLML